VTGVADEPDDPVDPVDPEDPELDVSELPALLVELSPLVEVPAPVELSPLEDSPVPELDVLVVAVVVLAAAASSLFFLAAAAAFLAAAAFFALSVEDAFELLLVRSAVVVALVVRCVESAGSLPDASCT